MKSIASFIRDFATVIGAEKFTVDHVQIYFDAPPKFKIQTLTLNKNKEREQNFQWHRYVLYLSTKGKEDRYIYEKLLEPWGTKQNTPPEVTAADESWTKQKTLPIKVTPREIEEANRDLLGKPNLNPTSEPEGVVTYVNENGDDKNKKYKPTEFKRVFEDSKTEDGTSFYLLVTKSGELKTPFGTITHGKTTVKGTLNGH